MYGFSNELDVTNMFTHDEITKLIHEIACL